MRADQYFHGLLLSALMMSVSGCSTMHFVQDVPLEQQDTRLVREWHSTTLSGTVEISPAVDLAKRCRRQPWKQATVEFGFFNGVVSLSVNSFTEVFAPALGYINLYAPWSVEIHCTKTQ